MRLLLSTAFLGCSAALSGGCETNPATGRSQLILVSGSELDAMGAEASPMLVQEYGGEVSESELRRYVNQVGDRLAQSIEGEFDQVDWRFTVLDSDVINAFALPGGRVFISRGLMARLSNEAELAAVLGHEMGHVTGRHIDERISRSTALDVGLQLGGAMSESQLAVAAASLFGQGYLLKFSRDQETEADRLGLRYMAESGYDPYAILGVLNVLLEEREGGRAVELLSTHPNPETRIQQAQRILNRQYRDVRNDSRYERFEDRYRQNALPYLRNGGNTRLGMAALSDAEAIPRCCSRD